MHKVLRIDPLETSTFQAGDKITLVMPQGVYDMSTFKLWFLADVDGTANNRSLPRDVETLCETMEVYIGDEQVQYTQHYNILFRLVQDFDNHRDDVEKRTYLSNSLYITTGLNSTQYNHSRQQFCMTKFLGFLGCKSVVDTRMMGPMRIVMTLAPNAVLLSSSAAATYILSDVYATVVEVDKDIGAQIPASIKFDNYDTTMQHNPNLQQSTDIFVRSKQLDYVVGTFLPPTYKTTVVSTATDPVGTSRYFIRGLNNGSTVIPLNFMFKLNNRNLITYYPREWQFIEYMNMIPEFTNSGTFLGPSFARAGNANNNTRPSWDIMNTMFACGVPLGGVDASGGVALSFETTAQPTLSLRTNLTFVVAKCTSRLEYNGNTYTFTK